MMLKVSPVWLAVFLTICLRAVGSDVSLGDVAAQKWLTLSVGELTIISDASEGKLREWAAEVAWFQDGLRKVLPLPANGTGEPATIFLFKSDRVMRQYLPDFGKNPMLLSGLFSSVAGHNVGMIGLSGSRFDIRAKLFHEMTHWHLARAGVDVPLWFHEGLAQVFETFTLQGAAFRIGHNQPELLHSVKIAGTPAVGPLLLKANLDYTRAGWKHGQTDLFYAQSWSLTHMLLFGANGGDRGRFTSYLNALRSGLTGSEAFAQGFGLTPEVARDRLDVYVRVPRWNFLILPLDRTVTGDSFKVGVLAPAEIYRQFGMLLLATGRTETAAQFVAYACAADRADARNWELAGVLALARQPVEKLAANEALERARTLSSQNPWVYAMLGWMALEGIEQNGNASRDLFRDARLQEAGNLFLAAVKLRPGFRPAVETMAGIVLASTDPKPEFREMVREGLVVAGGSAVVQLAVADEEIRKGQSASAARRLQKLVGRQMEIPEELVARAREMLATALAAPQD